MGSNYIVIEGLEGAGKTTARNVVVETLEQLGIRDMVFTREPGGTELAEKLEVWCWTLSRWVTRSSLTKLKF